jgi:hypothetical protein
METAFRHVIDWRGSVAANASAWNTTETKRVLDLFARTQYFQI